MGYNKGRPLYAYLNLSHIPGDADVRENRPAIELLVDHGADSRLRVRTGSISRPPRQVAKLHADNTSSPEMKVFRDRVVDLFEEAITKLEKKGQGWDEVTKINMEGREAIIRIFENNRCGA